MKGGREMNNEETTRREEEKKGRVTEDEVWALDGILDGVFSTWERGVDEREDEQIGLVLSLSFKVGHMVRN